MSLADSVPEVADHRLFVDKEKASPELLCLRLVNTVRTLNQNILFRFVGNWFVSAC